MVPSPQLGPWCVGRRVVVRRVLRDRTGPTGGPAYSDTLGMLESWSDGVAVVRTRTDEVVEIAIADIVAGKPIPPAPPRRT